MSRASAASACERNETRDPAQESRSATSWSQRVVRPMGPGSSPGQVRDVGRDTSPGATRAGACDILS